MSIIVHNVTRLDAQRVQLQIGNITEAATYNITVSNVQSTAGLPIDPVHNYIDFSVPDLNPQLISAALLSGKIRCIFSESMSDTGLTTSTNYVFSGPTTLTASGVLKISSTTVDVSVTEEMRTGATYTVTVSNVTDSGGKVIDPDNDSQEFTGSGVAPRVLSASLVDTTHVDVVFNEDLDSTTSQTAGNYSLSGPSTPTVTGAILDGDLVTVHLTLGTAMLEGIYTVSVEHVTDLVGNVVDPLYDTATFRSGLVLIMATGWVESTPGYEYTSDKTWSWDDSSWTLLSPAHPPVSPPGISYGRHQAGSAYDSYRKRVVLFGGQGYAGGYINTTWEFDGTDWTKITTAHSPPLRIYPSMTFDSLNNVVVLYGGYGGSGPLNDTWTYDGVDWTQQSPIASPSPGRYLNTIAYDPINHEVIIYGGNNSNYSYPEYWVDETWAYNGSTWTNKAPTHNMNKRVAAGSAWDEVNNCIVYFGGAKYKTWDTSELMNDTWKWTGTDWVEITTATKPAARNDFMMSTYPNHNRVVLVGGYNASFDLLYDTWAFNGSDWSNVSTSIPSCVGIARSTLCPSV